MPTRRVLFEGFLTKVCSNGRGKHKKYKVILIALASRFSRPGLLQFFLFTDLLVYASTGAFSSMFTMHGCIPLDSLAVRRER